MTRGGRVSNPLNKSRGEKGVEDRRGGNGERLGEEGEEEAEDESRRTGLEREKVTVEGCSRRSRQEVGAQMERRKWPLVEGDWPPTGGWNRNGREKDESQFRF
jgi:hypothetical protein